MMKFLVYLFIVSGTAFGGELTEEMAFDLGIGLAPSFTPEAGYDKAKLRLGIEFGWTYYRYEDSSLVDVKGLSTPRVIAKFLRLGVGSIDNKPVFLFSPISLYVQDRVYMSPTFGFGKNPYTIFSITYELFP